MKLGHAVIVGCLPVCAAVSLNAAAPAAKESFTDQVTIAYVGPNPPFASGVLHVTIEITGTANGENTSYFLTYLDPNQDRPKVGQHCAITWKWWENGRLAVGKGSQELGRLITKFDCKDVAA